jgi:allantoinase
MKYDLLIVNGTVVLESGIQNLTVAINDGKFVSFIKAGEALPEAHETIDASGKVILPGGIEPHGHVWEPGEDFREGWETGTQAAAAGGITTIIEMPLSNPPPVTREAFLLKKDIATHKSSIDFALWGGVIPESAQNLEKNLADLKELGAVAYKIFMCWSAQKYPPIDDGLLLSAMKELARTNQFIGIHAENDAIIKENERRLQAGGHNSPQDFVDSRPPEAELEAINRALLLGKVTGCRIHIVHMSINEGGRLLKQAKLNGQKVTVETAPQYLALDRSELDRKGAFAKCAPPLRTRENVELLWDYVLDGTIDMIGSDHAPFTREEKESPKLFWDVPNGLSGMQESFSLLLSEGVNKRGLSLNRAAEMTSTNVAKTFGLYPQKGCIRVGSDADLVIVDMNEEWIVDNARVFYKVGWSPYAGRKMKGKILKTILRGNTIYQNGEMVTKPGTGEFVRPV